MPTPPPIPRVERKFWNRVSFGQGPGACWAWTGARSDSGYGNFYANGRVQSSHRFSYEFLVGPIPDGLCIDHLCRNPNCVNPTHMEPVTTGENILRGVGASATNARKTHCKHGHRLSDDNVGEHHSGTGWRECLTCGRMKARKRRKADPQRFRDADQRYRDRLRARALLGREGGPEPEESDA